MQWKRPTKKLMAACGGTGMYRIVVGCGGSSWRLARACCEIFEGFCLTKSVSVRAQSRPLKWTAL